MCGCACVRARVRCVSAHTCTYAKSPLAITLYVEVIGRLKRAKSFSSMWSLRCEFRLSGLISTCLHCLIHFTSPLTDLFTSVQLSSPKSSDDCGLCSRSKIIIKYILLYALIYITMPLSNNVHFPKMFN